jgi:hypothetical protein
MARFTSSLVAHIAHRSILALKLEARRLVWHRF